MTKPTPGDLDCASAREVLHTLLDGDPLAAAESVRDIDAHFPGITAILKTWFSNYKGPGQLEFKGFGGPEEAMKEVDAAVANWAGGRN